MKKEEFENLYNMHYKEIYFVALKIVGDEHNAKDITQEAFLKAFTNKDKIENEEGFVPYVRMIAHNCAISYLRHCQVIKFESVDEEGVYEIKDDKKGPEDETIDKDVQQILMSLIEELPTEQKIVLFLYYYEEMSVKEIAGICGCSEKTIYSRLSYAKKNLRNEVEKIEDKGVRLRSIAVLPFLYAVFAMEAKEVFASPINISNDLIEEISIEGASDGKAETAVAKKSKGLLYGVIAGASTIVVAVAVIVAIVFSSGKNDDNTTKKSKDKDSVSQLGDTKKFDEDTSDINVDNTEDVDADNNTEVLEDSPEYDHDITYFNEEGLDGDVLSFFISKKSDEVFTQGLICKYKRDGAKAGEFVYCDGRGSFFYSGTDSEDKNIKFESKIDTTDRRYFIWDGSLGMGEDGYFGTSIEISLESTLKVSDYDLERVKVYNEDAVEVYQEGNFFVTVKKNYEDKIYYDVFFYENSVELKINFQFDEGEVNKDKVKALLYRLQFESYGDDSTADIKNCGFAEDIVRKNLAQYFNIYLRDPQYIRTIMNDEITYNTGETSYKIQTEWNSEVDDDYKLHRKYEGYKVYYDGKDFILIDSENELTIYISMKSDIDDDDVSLKYDRLRQDILK